MKGEWLALSAGMCAALASVCAKLAFSSAINPDSACVMDLSQEVCVYVSIFPFSI